jgi:DNA-binding NarL/FixJ family response regulator
MKPLRIFVADDHEVVRRGLRETLESLPGWQVVGEAATGREASERIRQLKPDVVILDWTLPELNGPEVCRRILRSLPKTEILILTPHQTTESIRAAIGAGARSCLFKTDTARDLTEAVASLAQHRSFFTPKATDMMLHEALEGDGEREERALRRLTARERQVIGLLAEGKINKDIASILGITPKTAMAHRARIMQKLGLDTLSDLARFALRHKIIGE